jgi:hypothetical protein
MAGKRTSAGNPGADPEQDDRVLGMLAVGKEIWATESGDRFVERLRSEELPGELRLQPRSAHSTD